jgi:cytochrome c556
VRIKGEDNVSRFALLSGPIIAIAMGSALLVADHSGSSTVAFAQDQSAATTKDVIFARKIMMDTIGTNMDEIDTMLQTGKIDLTEAREHADMISVMLMAFPHLFPPNSDQWKPNVERDPGTDTFAAPEVWKTYSNFYEQAAFASKTAYKASRATDEAEFKKFGAELRAACDTCHSTYLKQQ